MAVILLQVAGATLGGAFGPVGAAVGQAAGALAGSLIDTSLINSTRTIRGRQLGGVRLPGADEGEPVARVHGTARIAGTLIWATRFEESVTVERQGGKASGPKVETYNYHGNFAIGLCEGPIAGVRRVWADGRELDLTGIEMRVHTGGANQIPDPLIEAKQDEGRTPAWRGLAYVVFERLPLDGFGNRIPMLHFEVLRPVGDLEQNIRAVAVIPGATEHGYALTPVSQTPGPGEKRFLNRHTRRAATDWTASIDELQALCPNLESVALVISWMGTDLRAGHCEFHPCVETSTRPGESRPWKVGGLTRATARQVGRLDAGPVYGGTPDDLAVIEAIRDLKARGLKVVLYPFVLMDIVAGNGLPDPHGGAEQAALPWRGRVTCHPAPGRAGTPDETDTINAEIAAFCGTGIPTDILVGTDRIDWAGGDAGYRRMILHHAGLALAAGGVDGFLIGSELTGLTRLRDGTGEFPFVSALCALADDVKAMLGEATVVTYGADWSEYFGYHPADGSGDVRFHLDELWAHPAIGAVGIDNYMPLSDWRDGDFSDGNPDSARHGNDRAAMRAAITSGEGYDWYYASVSDRAARIRTPIGDGLAGKDWIYRFKDIRGWWQNVHYDRTGGVEAAQPSAWVPASKPVWMTEIGCPAVDKGANQPNVFPDARSSEGALPWFSTGARDDSAQRALISAHLDHWNGPANADLMVDPAHIHLWTWDARPYPVFPSFDEFWADGGNWRSGHWLNGRLGGCDLADLVAAILAEAGFDRFDVSGVTGAATGHVTAGIGTARSVLEPLMEAFCIDMRESPTGLEFVSRLRAGRKTEVLDVLADPEAAPRFEEVRAQTGELPSAAMMRFFDPGSDHEAAAVRSRRPDGGREAEAELAFAGAIDTGTARLAADLWLGDRWAARRRLAFALPPGRVEIEPGDTFRLAFEGAPSGVYRIVRIEDGSMRRIEALGHAEPHLHELSKVSLARPGNGADAGFAPDLVLADLPLLRGEDETVWAVAAAQMRPWRPLIVSSSTGDEGYRPRLRLNAPARLGRLAAPLPPGAIEGRFDRGGTVHVALDFGGLESVSEAALLDGANAAAIEAENGAWEIVQFLNAEEVSAGLWQLTGLLRGQAGTDDAMRGGAAAGARFTMLDGSVRSLGLTGSEAGLVRNFIVEPAGLPAEPGLDPIAFAGGLRARTPLSPVHLSARREAGGIRVNWIRRGRIGADGWLAAEIPFTEESERYRVDVLVGENIVRSAEVSAPNWLYPAADELADFGVALDRIKLRVSQGGLHVPWGIARTATIAVN